MEPLTWGTGSLRLVDFRAYNAIEEKVLETEINNFKLVAKSDTAATVAYDYDSEAGYTSFDIFVNDSLYTNTTDKHNVILIKNLTPNTDYKISMVAHNGSGKTKPAEVQVTTDKSRLTASDVNVALGADVTTTGTTSTNYPTVLLVNGFAGFVNGTLGKRDQWFATSDSGTVDIEIDLGEELNIYKAEIKSPASYGLSTAPHNADSYIIYGAGEDKVYTKLYECTAPEAVIRYTADAPVKCRYIKINLKESSVNSSGKYEYRLGDIGIYSAGNGFRAYKPTITADDSSVTAKSSYTGSGTDSEMLLLLALYNGDSLVKADKIILTDASVAADLSVRINTSGITYTKAKAFVWNNINELIPIADMTELAVQQ